MSEQSPFKLPLATQPNAPFGVFSSNNTPNVASVPAGSGNLNPLPTQHVESSSGIFSGTAFIKPKEMSLNTDTSIIFGGSKVFGGHSNLFGNSSSPQLSNVLEKSVTSDGLLKSSAFVTSSSKGEDMSQDASKAVTFINPSQLSSGVRPSIFGGSSAKPVESFGTNRPNPFGGTSKSDEPPFFIKTFTNDASKPSESFKSSQVCQTSSSNISILDTKTSHQHMSPSATGTRPFKVTFRQVIEPPPQEMCSSTSFVKQESPFQQKPSLFGGSSSINVFRVPLVPFTSNQSSDISSKSETVYQNIATGSCSSSEADTSKLIFSVDSKPGNTVSSSMSHPFLKKSNMDCYAQNEAEEENESELGSEKEIENLDRDWEPDSVSEEDQDENRACFQEKKKSFYKSSKEVRKRSVFSKALDDVSRLPEKQELLEEMKSVYCRPIDGKLPEKDVIKTHFSQYGAVSRIVLNLHHQYCTVTYKTHEEAATAMSECSQIGEIKVHLFWRNTPKLKRRAEEDVTKAKLKDGTTKKSRGADKVLHPDERKESYEFELHPNSKRALKSEREPQKRLKKDKQLLEMEMDTEVREELAALSQLDYQSHESRHRSEGESAKTTTKALKSRLGRVTRERKSTEKSPDVKHKKSRLKKTEKVNDSESSNKNIEKDTVESASIASSSIGSTTGAIELTAIMKTPAFTSEEKLKVLDARDKLIRLRLVKQCDLSKAVKTVGTCPDMCPEKERLLRETRRQVSQYEMTSSKMDPALMVKQYSRSSADQEEPLPHELRPSHVLTMTMNYLLHTIMDFCDRAGENLAEWYHFLWDRTRGIRKEITQQELCDLDTVSLVEQCARFHIHCCARLVAEDMSVFDDRINTENLTKCLQTLKHMYHDLWIKSSVTCPNEPEFITYFILLNLNNGTIMWEMEQLREEVLTSPEIAFATSLYSSLSSNNFVQFFRLVRKASYLNSCLCIRYFYQMRSRALRTYVKALAKLRPITFPLSSLVRNLGFESIERAAAFCAHHGLQVEESLSENSCVVLSARSFYIPDSILPHERAFQLVEVKKSGTVGEVVYGGALPARSFEHHVPHNSFGSNGLLHANAHSAKDQGLTSGERDIDLLTGDSYHDENILPQNIALCQDIKTSDSESGFQGEANIQAVATTSLPSLSVSTSFGTSIQFSAANVVVPALMPVQSASKQPENIIFTRTFGASSGSPSYLAEQSLRVNVQNKSATGEPNKMTVKVSEEEIDVACNQHQKEILDVVLQEGIKEIATSVLDDARTKEKEAKEQELRERILLAHVDRISVETVNSLLEELLPQLIFDLAFEAEQEERLLHENIEYNAVSILGMLISDVVEEESRISATEARNDALQCLVSDCFYHWLSVARRSLRMKYAMEDFPAGVLPLSIKEHAQRWGLPDENQLKAWKGRFGRHEKAIDLPEFKASPSYTRTTLADIIGVLILHRYDVMRPRLGLHPTNHLLFKLFVSVPDQGDDPASELIDWWIRRAFKQNNSMLFDGGKMGVLRLISGQKVTPEVAVYASLQMVKGGHPVKELPSLVSGTSAVLFSVSPSSNISDSQLRLRILLEASLKLPPVPLIVVVVSPSQPPLEGLKQLVVELQLDYWLMQNVICDYQILYVEGRADVEKLTNRVRPALNYLAMTWTPTPQLDVVFLRNILMSTFQMFYISIQFNYNNSEVYPQDVDDPRIIIGLCNEWLDLMCDEFIGAFQEAKNLYGEEFWPLLHKGVFLPFYKNPQYENYIKKVMMSIKLPEVKEWPPSSEAAFESWFVEYISWLRQDDLKQTLKRLSCLSNSTFPEKIRKIPWIQLVEGWIDARIRYADTTGLNNSECVCVIRALNVEQLYSNTWWAHSKHICAYLESHKTGKESEMDTDETIPSSNVMDQSFESSANSSTELDKPTALHKIKEVADCVEKLKSVNASLMSRLKEALCDDSLNQHLDTSICASEIHHGTKDKVTTDMGSLLKSITSQIQVQQNVNCNTDLLLSTALSGACAKDFSETDIESGPFTAFKDCEEEIEEHLDQPSKDNAKEELECHNINSTNKMTDIMKSMNEILSSLEQKHYTSEKGQRNDRLTGLKIGTEKAVLRISPFSKEILQHSAFVEQSEQRMKEHVLKNVSSDNEDKVSCKKKIHENSDSDLEVLFENEDSVSSYSKSFSSLSSRVSQNAEDSHDDTYSHSEASSVSELEVTRILSSDDSVSYHELSGKKNLNYDHKNRQFDSKNLDLAAVSKEILDFDHHMQPTYFEPLGENEKMFVSDGEHEEQEDGIIEEVQDEDEYMADEEVEEEEDDVEEEEKEADDESFEAEEENLCHTEVDVSSPSYDDNLGFINNKKEYHVLESVKESKFDPLVQQSEAEEVEEVNSDEPFNSSSEHSGRNSKLTEVLESESESVNCDPQSSSGFVKDESEERSRRSHREEHIDNSYHQDSSSNGSESRDGYSNSSDSQQEAEDSEYNSEDGSHSDDDCEVIDDD